MNEGRLANAACAPVCDEAKTMARARMATVLPLS